MLDQLFPYGTTHYFVGGLLIGAGVSLLFLATGLIGGVSTFFSATWSYVSAAPFFQQPRFVNTRGWRLLYAAGLVLGAAVFVAATGHAVATTQVSSWQLLAGGFLVGFGARLSNGCTSGHGICGMASLQMPSILAVIIFLTTGILTAHAVLTLGGR